MNLLIRTDRFFAWILFISVILFFISGYGMTKGVITNSFAIDIHNKLLPPIVILAFTIHGWFAIHMAFKRWQIWNIVTKILLATFFVIFLSYFGYIHYVYQQKTSSNDIDAIKGSSDVGSDTASGSSVSETTTTKEKSFTLEELTKYNGKSGQPAYVAVDGKVYDLTSVFASGKHYSHFAGSELTSAFYSYHAAKSLAKYPVVGTLAK